MKKAILIIPLIIFISLEICSSWRSDLVNTDCMQFLVVDFTWVCKWTERYNDFKNNSSTVNEIEKKCDPYRDVQLFLDECDCKNYSWVKTMEEYCEAHRDVFLSTNSYLSYIANKAQEEFEKNQLEAEAKQKELEEKQRELEERLKLQEEKEESTTKDISTDNVNVDGNSINNNSIENKVESYQINKSEIEQAINWMYDKWLTVFNEPISFHAYNWLRRDEAAKFFVKYAKEVMGMIPDYSKQWCSFKDLDQAWSDLKDIIVESCQLWLFQWNKWKFMPTQQLTNAQAITVFMRLREWYKDESLFYQKFHKIVEQTII